MMADGNLDILTSARGDVLQLQREIEAETLTTDKATKYRRCCVAVLLHQCGFSREAVCKMTVQDWLRRRGDDLGGVSLSVGNVAHHVGTSTEKMLEFYYTRVRPSLLPKTGTIREFLVAQGGIPLYNPLADVSRLQEEYEARRRLPACHQCTVRDPDQADGQSTSPPPPTSSALNTSEEVDVLDRAKEEMLYLQKRLTEKKAVSHRQCTDFRRYCQVLLMRRCCLTARAVTDMDVRSWLERAHDDRGCVLLTTAGSTYSMTEFTVKMLETYFRRVRPAFVSKQRSQEKASGAFFVSDGGVPLKNLWTDATRLKARYTRGEAASAGLCSPDRMWDDFLSAFPVSPSSKAPSKAECEAAGFASHLPLYKKWRTKQRAERQQHILAQAQNRAGTQPTLAAVQRKLERERWRSNVPSKEEVLKAWAAPPDSQAEMQRLLQSVREQSWMGLAVVDFGAAKGKGVVAVMPLTKGCYVCDYHGTTITGAEGNKRFQSGYLFFFKDSSGNSLCVDATEFPCSCHPTLDTFGRRLNHSRKRSNVAPKVHYLDLGQGKQPIILFHTLRDVDVGEELLWDYGVSRSSFGGEGRALKWLDE